MKVGGFSKWLDIVSRAGAGSLLFAVAGFSAEADRPAAADLNVGWAVVDITPPLGSGRKPVLAGLMVPRFPDTVDEPILVTALALEDRGSGNSPVQAVIVSCDIAVGTHNQWMRESLMEELRTRLRGRIEGLDLSRMYLMCTHTHNAPSFMEGMYALPDESWVLRPSEYREFLLQKLEQVVENAWQRRSRMSMAWALGQASVGFNRRVVYDDGLAAIGGWRRNPAYDHIEGREEHALKALYFWNPQGELTGVAINVAAPSQVQIQELVISSDYWGDVRRQLAKRPGFEKAVVFPMLAAAGDQWPYQQIRDKAEAVMRDRRGLDLPAELARRIVREVEDLLPLALKDVQTRMMFRHAVSGMNIPLRVITAEEKARIDAEYVKQVATPSPMQHQWVKRLGLLKERYERQKLEKLTAPIEIHVLRLGDVAIATNPFELYVDYGVQIESRSPAILTLTTQLSAELGTGLAYLPTERAIPHQGYSADIMYNNCLVGPEGGRLLVQETVKQLIELWK